MNNEVWLIDVSQAKKETAAGGIKLPGTDWLIEWFMSECE